MMLNEVRHCTLYKNIQDSDIFKNWETDEEDRRSFFTVFNEYAQEECAKHKIRLLEVIRNINRDNNSKSYYKFIFANDQEKLKFLLRYV